jgi:hypothetical protein
VLDIQSGPRRTPLEAPFDLTFPGSPVRSDLGVLHSPDAQTGVDPPPRQVHVGAVVESLVKSSDLGEGPLAERKVDGGAFADVFPRGSATSPGRVVDAGRPPRTYGAHDDLFLARENGGREIPQPITLGYAAGIRKNHHITHSFTDADVPLLGDGDLFADR